MALPPDFFEVQVEVLSGGVFLFRPVSSPLPFISPCWLLEAFAWFLSLPPTQDAFKPTRRRHRGSLAPHFFPLCLLVCLQTCSRQGVNSILLVLPVTPSGLLKN